VDEPAATVTVVGRTVKLAGAVRVMVPVIPAGTGWSSVPTQLTVEPFCSNAGVHTHVMELGASGIVMSALIVEPVPVMEAVTVTPDAWASRDKQMAITGM
jgi:hypothetical protein